MKDSDLFLNKQVKLVEIKKNIGYGNGVFEGLKKSTKQRMPQPTGYRIVVMPFQGFAKSKGGILLSDETRERESLATVVAYIVQLGPDAYKDKSKFPSGPYCKQGDWAIIGKYAGTRIKLEDGEIRILNDDEILGTILEPTDVYTI